MRGGRNTVRTENDDVHDIDVALLHVSKPKKMTNGFIGGTAGKIVECSMAAVSKQKKKGVSG